MNETHERFLPAYGHSEVHSIRLAVPPERAWEALFAVTVSDLPLPRALMAIRTLPARLRGGGAGTTNGSVPLVDRWLRGDRWLTLAEDAGRAFVVGRIARFWQPVAEEPGNVRDADDFIAFQQPGFAKAIMSFQVLPEGTGSRLVTETRIQGTDAHARRLFAAYWLLIRPGSGLIRRSILHAVRRRCETARAPVA
jgi:hypothetical protein